jgi:hypothetical protein
MNCIFTTNDFSDSTYPLLQAAINSLQRNTTLTPVVVWMADSGERYFKGSEALKMVKWLEEREVRVFYHTPKWIHDIEHFSFHNVKYKDEYLSNIYTHYPTYYNLNFIKTESLRIDIPKMFPDEKYVLYADCDTLFLKDISIINFDEPLAAALRHTFFNNGVMLLNISKMLETYDDFLKFYLQSNYSFDTEYTKSNDITNVILSLNTTTQAAYNIYYHNRVSQMPLEMNWHIDWGKNEGIQILHFCGPKPHDYIKMMKEIKELKAGIKSDPLFYGSFFYKTLHNSTLKYFLEEWNKYAESPVSIPEFNINVGATS